jgi:hypothetical protein
MKMSSGCNIILNTLKTDIKEADLSDNIKKDMTKKINDVLKLIDGVNTNTIFDYSSDESGYSTERSGPPSPYKK